MAAGLNSPRAWCQLVCPRQAQVPREIPPSGRPILTCLGGETRGLSARSGHHPGPGPCLARTSGWLGFFCDRTAARSPAKALFAGVRNTKRRPGRSCTVQVGGPALIGPPREPEQPVRSCSRPASPRRTRVGAESRANRATPWETFDEGWRQLIGPQATGNSASNGISMPSEDSTPLYSASPFRSRPWITM